MRAFISLSLYAQRYSPESKSTFPISYHDFTSRLWRSADRSSGNYEIHKPATPGLGTESGCRPRDRHELLKKSSFFFLPHGFAAFCLHYPVLTFFRRSVAALAAGKSYCRQPPATGKRFFYSLRFLSTKEGNLRPDLVSVANAIRGFWFIGAAYATVT